MHGDDFYIYKDNNRIMKMKDVDRYINKIGNEKDSLKRWIFLGVSCLLTGAMFLLVSDTLKLKKSPEETQTNQETKIRSLNNPTKTVIYITPNRTK